MFRTISIDPVLNGYSVMIKFPEGDQELVFNTLDALLQELRDYYTDPQGAEEHYRNTVNAQHIIRANAVQEQANPSDYYYNTGGGGTIASHELPTLRQVRSSVPSSWAGEAPSTFSTGQITLNR